MTCSTTCMEVAPAASPTLRAAIAPFLQASVSSLRQVSMPTPAQITTVDAGCAAVPTAAYSRILYVARGCPVGP
ncbi:MAG: hypothetical protein U0641_11830 [Anaerolineae bacterium]